MILLFLKKEDLKIHYYQKNLKEKQVIKNKINFLKVYSIILLIQILIHFIVLNIIKNN